MRISTVLLMVLVNVSGLARAAVDYAAIDERETRAAALVMERLHAAFPPEPIELEGRLRTRSRDGEILAEYNLALLYERTESEFSVELELRDAFGELIERAELDDVGGADPKISYWKADGQQEAHHPGLQESLGKTDFSWSDLTLAFLWWGGEELIGVDSMKGRECYIVDAPAPQPAGEIAGVKLWIDSEMYALLRAVFYDSERETVKRFDVKSFAKTGDLWVPKDLDMRSYPSRRRTTLRVREVRHSPAVE